MEEMDASSDSHQAILGSTHSLNVSKPAHLPRPGTASNSDSSHATPCGNIVIIENSLHNRGASSSVMVPFNSSGCPGGVLPLSNKLKISHKSVKTMPKITVNANNLQRLQQKGKPPSQQQSVSSRKNPVHDIDDELGNILDIPIIFAKDDDLGSIDRMPMVTQSATMVKELPDKPKLNSTTTKVVLISNKQDKLQQTQHNKLGASSTQAVICPTNMPVQNLNHLILQARSQNTGNSSGNSGSNVASAKNRVGMPMLESRLVQQPTVKYTKIILAKRHAPPPQRSKRGEQMIATKTSDDTCAPKILTFEKDDNRFVQASPSVSTTYEDPFATGSVLEIEDAIKTNIIERKYTSTAPVIGPTSPIILADDDCLTDILDEAKLDETPQPHSKQSATFDNTGEMQS